VSETLEVLFPGGKRVDIRVGDFLVRTDQSVKSGGEASAPEPFDVFLASLAGCAGIFALNFCQSRNLETEGLGLRLDWEPPARPPDPAQVIICLSLPKDFPEKYRDSIVRAVDQCTVKKYLFSPPQFQVRVGP